MSNTQDIPILEQLFESGAPYNHRRHLKHGEVIIMKTVYPEGTQSRNTHCQKAITYERLEEYEAKELAHFSYSRSDDPTARQPIQTIRVCDEGHYLKYGSVKKPPTTTAAETKKEYLARIFKTGTPLNKFHGNTISKNQVIVIKLAYIDQSQPDDFDSLSDLSLARAQNLHSVETPYDRNVIAIYRVCNR